MRKAKPAALATRIATGVVTSLGFSGAAPRPARRVALLAGQVAASRQVLWHLTGQVPPASLLAA